MSDRPTSGAPDGRATPLRVWLRRAVLAALASAGLILSWAFEQSTVQHANRLHRAGAVEAAAGIFREHATDDAPQLRYNLGTSLLESGDLDAADELQAAASAADATVRARAHYNAGLLNLRRALDGAEDDSLRTLAAAAVEENRAALVLRPEHGDTKWNLALAQRLLDSLDAGSRDAGQETAESALEADEVVQSENVLEVDEEQELPEDAPMEGEDETRADVRDEDAMSLAEAAEILSVDHLDAELMVRKLLALESRSYWGRRLATRGPRR